MSSASATQLTPPDEEVRTHSIVTGNRHGRYLRLSGSALRTTIGVTAGLCFLAFGYGQGDIGGYMLTSRFRDEFPEMDAATYPNLHVATVAGAVVAAWNLGCIAGAFAVIFLSNVLGRKGSIIAGLVIEIIGKIVQISSFSFGQFIAGRVIAGVGNGFIASSVPAWQAECLKTHRRGTLLMVSFGASITAGLAIAYWISYGLSFASPNSVSWRFPIAFSLIFLIPALVTMFFMPESPRYLILSAKEDAALNVFSALNELPSDHEDIRREVLLVKNTVMSLASGGSFSNLFTMGKTRNAHRVILAVVIQIMQQFTGVNLFLQYLGSMFANQLKYPITRSLMLAGCCSTVFFLASLVAVVGIDRFWGRRSLTMFGASGMSICMTVLCIMAYLATQTSHYIMTAFLFLYLCFFSLGWQGMSFLWGVELLPLSVRGPANALASAANWLSNFIVVFTCPVMFTMITYKTYVTYAVLNAIFVPLVYFFLPETGNRSLEEIDLLFTQATVVGKPWLSVVGVARKEPVWYGDESKREASYSGMGSTGTWEEGSSEGYAHNKIKPVGTSSNETSPARRLEGARVDERDSGQLLEFGR